MEEEIAREDIKVILPVAALTVLALTVLGAFGAILLLGIFEYLRRDMRRSHLIDVSLPGALTRSERFSLMLAAIRLRDEEGARVNVRRLEGAWACIKKSQYFFYFALLVAMMLRWFLLTGDIPQLASMIDLTARLNSTLLSVFELVMPLWTLNYELMASSEDAAHVLASRDIHASLCVTGMILILYFVSVVRWKQAAARIIDRQGAPKRSPWGKLTWGLYFFSIFVLIYCALILFFPANVWWGTSGEAYVDFSGSILMTVAHTAVWPVASSKVIAFYKRNHLNGHTFRLWREALEADDQPTCPDQNRLTR